MTVTYEVEVEVSDETHEQLESDGFGEERIKSAVRETLQDLASVEDQRAEMRDRLGLSGSSDDEAALEELPDDERAELIREQLREQRGSVYGDSQ
jgi:hypothetical protein